jgi:hypothetical protein
MKSKGPKKTALQNVQTKKVFDVTRPGKTPVSPTSRPVIVGHKPQVKDPMMSDRDDTRPLMDSTKKVTIEPGADAATPPTQSSSPNSSLPPTDSDSAVLPLANASLPQVGSRKDVAGGTDGGAPGARNVSEHGGEASMSDRTRTPEDANNAMEGEKPAEPSTADSVATIATSSVVDDVPPPQEDTAEPKPASSTTTGNTTSGLVFDDLDGSEDTQHNLTKPTPDSASTDTSPAAHESPSSVLADPSASPAAGDEQVTEEPTVSAQAVVSHHKQPNSGAVILITLLVLLLAAGIVFDILLDMGILNLGNIPHTNFFSN